ncbi:MAG: glycosyltransferase family 2 protein [Planctomycetes bacterium]|nr:glycosyltransferase family 2 protein [Planctomycetota bacterium]
MPESKRKLISVITPTYNEEMNVVECYQTVRRVFEEQLPQYDYEHVFADNASPDRTVDRLRELAAADSRVKVIVHSRNFGALASLFNALLSTSGDAVMVMVPADLQDPPRLIPDFVREWEKGFKVVYGIRKNRQEFFLMRFVRWLYYRLVSYFSEIHIPLDVGEFQLVDRCVIHALREFEDYYPYLRGMIASCGFKSTGIAYTWERRKQGLSKGRLLNLIDQGLNGIISFTKVPMRLAMLAGLTLATASLIYAFVAFVINLLYYRQIAPPGIPTLIIALFFFSGVQLFFFGILGEYIGAIHFQVRRRPLVVVAEKINFATSFKSESGQIGVPISETPADGSN